MALQSGLEYSDSMVNFEDFENCSSKRRMGQLMVSYSDRLAILEQATGLTETELLKREAELMGTPMSTLHHSKHLLELSSLLQLS